MSCPIRERRLEYAKDMGEVFLRMLEKSSQAAREVAGQTLAEVKEGWNWCLRIKVGTQDNLSPFLSGKRFSRILCEIC